MSQNIQFPCGRKAVSQSPVCGTAISWNLISGLCVLVPGTVNNTTLQFCLTANGDFLHRTFEHRPNQTLDIYVYNTTTYDEGTHLGRHIALNPLPFLTIKTTWQKDSFCPKTAKCWFKIRVTRITLQKRIQEYYDTTILVLFFPEFKRDKGYAS